MAETKQTTHREITDTFKEMCDADVSPGLISKVTDAVKERVIDWQNRPWDTLYPIIYLDCIVTKVRQDNSAINLEGRKELLGLWIAENKGAKFWLVAYSPNCKIVAYRTS